MRTFVNVVLLAGGVYALLTAYLFFFQSRFVYFPNMPGRELISDPRTIGLEFEEVRFSASDGTRIHGWWVPASSSRGLVLFLHGNAGNISHRLHSIRVFHELGWSVFIFDYRGYGLSEGKPTEQGIYQDASAAWKHAVEEKRVEPREIVVFGRSLGGAVAAWLASQTEPGALIVESTFTSVPDMAQEIYPFLPARWLARIRYDARTYLAGVRCPVLIVHSRQDELIPFHHGQALFDAVRSDKAFLEMTGGHNDGPLVTGPSYAAGIEQFLATHLRNREGS